MMKPKGQIFCVFFLLICSLIKMALVFCAESAWKWKWDLMHTTLIHTHIIMHISVVGSMTIACFLCEPDFIISCVPNKESKHFSAYFQLTLVSE